MKGKGMLQQRKKGRERRKNVEKGKDVSGATRKGERKDLAKAKNGRERLQQ